MASISSTTRSILLAESGVTDIVSTRVYPLAFPANATFPLIVYRVISGAHYNKAAVVQAEKSTRFQFDTWAYTYAECQAMKVVFHVLWDEYRGVVSGQRVLSTSIDLEFDLYEDDTKLYRYTCDISVQHEGA